MKTTRASTHRSINSFSTINKITGTKDGDRFVYHGVCNRHLSAGDQEIKLALQDNKAILNKEFKGKLDSSYKPRLNKNFVRYTGFDGFDPEWGVTLLVEKSLLEGKKQGIIKLQATGESFETNTYHCTLEPGF